ncbi:MAG: 6-bladed beta-propeller [Candidatus Delongbacteria bacterium]|jgi:hypothetical protein|nr:6-bladed beta-propeller [Candidatus Delongbacteria bacterium]
MKNLIVLFTLIILISCSKKPEAQLNYEIKVKDGIEHIINENRPSVPVEDLKIDLKISFVINGMDTLDVNKCYFSKVTYFTVDSKDNIFIYDESKVKVNKFDNAGNYIQNFGGSGTGPGEFRYAMGLACLNDTILVFDTNSRKLNKFNTDGKFYGTSVMNSKVSLFNKLYVANENIWCHRLSFKRDGDDLEMYKLIEIRDNHFNVLTVIDSSSIEYPPKSVKEELSISKAIAVSKDQIYMTDKGDCFTFKISVLNESGDLQKVIRKKFARMKISDKEKELNTKEMQSKGFLETEEHLEEYLKILDYKPAIRWIHVDKYDRLWVNESRHIEDPSDNRMKFSIFKDGIYLNSALLDLDVTEPNFINDVLYGNDLVFTNSKIYAMNTSENRITVYEY